MDIAQASNQIADTIFALSSGSVPSGVAIVRISGPNVRFILESLCAKLPLARQLVLSDITASDKYGTGDLIDRGLIVYFPYPESFTGEDMAELHVHGSRAVVGKLLNTLGRFEKTRMAEAGEFSRRAFENSKLDLTEAEGIADLLAADTERQHELAILASSGRLGLLFNEWRRELIRCRGLIEAGLDFSDEGDVADDFGVEIDSAVKRLSKLIDSLLDDSRGGEFIRDGLRVALMGPPNSGKSSLLNALAKRDIAIVSDEAGTTRDVIEVTMDVSGIPVIVSDTAGIRVTENQVEVEGIRRALLAAESADLVIWLDEYGGEEQNPPAGMGSVARFKSKADLVDDKSEFEFWLSTVDPFGLDQLIGFIGNEIAHRTPKAGSMVVVRARQRLLLEKTLAELSLIENVNAGRPEIISEHLRIASEYMGRITGRVDVEDLLDFIFSEFCVGK